MATVSRNFVENQSSTQKATWTVTIAETGANASLNVSSDFTLAIPTVTAKYVYGGSPAKSTGMATVSSYLDIVDVWVDAPIFRHNTTPEGSMISWSSGTTKTLPCEYHENTSMTLSEVFTEDNKDSLTLSVHAVIDAVSLYSGPYFNGYSEFGTFDLGEVATITLNVPPTVAYNTPIYSTPHYAGLGAYSVTVTQAEAYYGGDVQTITLTVGSDSTTQNYSSATVTNQTLSVTPSVAGTFTPTLTITDTRGQVTTINFEQIIVNAYTVPNISFDLQRTNGSGIPTAEGEHGFVTASISYTDAIAELTQPTVAVRDEGGNLVVSSATWYETWDATNGVSDAVNWTNYNPQSPATLYAVVSATGSTLSPNESYTISITPTDNMGGVAQTITQTLSTGFFTIDFQAGGKEIAFGAPANDDITNYPEGLFKCAMSFVNVNMVGEIKAYAGATVPTGWLECDGSEVLKADYPILYRAIADSWGVASDSDHFVLPNFSGRVPVGYDSNDTDFDTVGGMGGSKYLQEHTHDFTQPTVSGGSGTISGGAHTHPVYYSTFEESGSGTVHQQLKSSGSSYNTGSTSHSHSLPAHTHSVSGGAVGVVSGATTGTSNNIQPYAVVKYIICAV